MRSGRTAALLAIFALGWAGSAAAEEAPRPGAPTEARPGWYAGVSISAATNAFERALQRKTGINVSTNETVGFGGRVGYRFAPRFAAEAQLEWLDPFEADAGTLCSSDVPPTRAQFDTAVRNGQVPTGINFDQLDTFPCRGREFVFPTTDPVRSGEPFSIEPIVATLNARTYLGTGRWQPYLLFGGGLMYVNFNDEGFCPTATLTCGNDFEALGYALRIGGGLEYYMTESFVLTLGASYVLPLTGQVRDFDYVSFEPFGITYRFR